MGRQVVVGKLELDGESVVTEVWLVTVPGIEGDGEGVVG